MKVTIFHKKLGYFMFLYIIYAILSCLSLHYSQNKPKEKAPPKKRSRLQRPMKLTSSTKRTKF